MPESGELLDLLEAVLDRRTELGAVEALKRAAFPQRTADEGDPRPAIALGLDSNVVLKLADRGRAEVIDYLAGVHAAPLVLPGQVVQEFWKNTFAEIQTIGTQVLQRYRQIADDIRRMTVDVDPFPDRFQELVDEFVDAYGSIYDEATERRIRAVLDALERKATIKYVPRARFHPLAEVRQRTKTPPGFMDQALGDFYVWADFLYGLLTVSEGDHAFGLVVFVTDDTKKDWSRNGQAHPVLVAEVTALIGRPFEIWTFAQLSGWVGQQLSTRAHLT